MIGNFSKDEVIIIDYHDDIFKGYQINFWRKDRISDILPAIKCPSFKSLTKIFKTSELFKIDIFIRYENNTKSIILENAGDKLSINLFSGNTVKIRPSTFDSSQQTNFLDKLKERIYELWEIEDCTCKPKKIRVEVKDFEALKYAIGELESISNTNDVKLGIDIDFKYYNRSFSKYDTIVFNNLSRRMSDKKANLIFTGDTLAVVSDGNYYNFRLDQSTKESENSIIKGKI